jgi:hypothetical protein
MYSCLGSFHDWHHSFEQGLPRAWRCTSYTLRGALARAELLRVCYGVGYFFFFFVTISLLFLASSGSSPYGTHRSVMYKSLVRVGVVDSVIVRLSSTSRAKHEFIFTSDPFVERILSYQKVDGVVSDQMCSVMTNLTRAIAATLIATWVTRRRQPPQRAQILWGLPSPVSLSMSLDYQIGSDTSSETMVTGTRTWLRTITLAEVTP